MSVWSGNPLISMALAPSAPPALATRFTRRRWECTKISGSSGYANDPEETYVNLYPIYEPRRFASSDYRALLRAGK